MYVHKRAGTSDGTAGTRVVSLIQMPRDSLFVRPRVREIHVVLLLAALIGVLGAFVTVAFRMAIRGVEWVFTGHDAGLVEAAMSLAWWQRLLVPAVGGLIAGGILQLGLRLVRGRTTTDYMEAVAVGDGVLGVRTSLVKSVSSLLTIGSGGRSAAKARWCNWRRWSARSPAGCCRTPSRGCGCWSPAARRPGWPRPTTHRSRGRFVAEIVLGSIAMESLGPMIVSSVVSAATVHQLLGFAPVFAIPPLHFVSGWETLFYLALGVVCGAAAPLFLFVLTGVEKAFGRLAAPLYAKLGLGGLIVGALSVARPESANGYSVVTEILHSRRVAGGCCGARAQGRRHRRHRRLRRHRWRVHPDDLRGRLARLPARRGGAGGVPRHGGTEHLRGGRDGGVQAATTRAPVMSILMIFEMTSTTRSCSR